jgi:hypothetical protein
MELLVRSFIATFVMILIFVCFGALLLAVMNFGGIVGYSILIFLVFWFITYIGMATYEIEKEIEGKDDE